MKTPCALGVQLAVTNLVTLMGFGIAGHWVAGLAAPYIGLWHILGFLFLPSDPLFNQMGTYVVGYLVLLALIGFSLRGTVPRPVGHVALLLFNTASAVLLVATA